MPRPKFMSEKNQVDVDLALATIAACPTLQAASEHLKQEYNIIVTEKTLKVYEYRYRGEFEKIRNQLAPLREQSLANDMLDVASMATQVEQVAIEHTMELLAAGKVSDPSKVARDLADVKAKSVEKRLAIQGRPTSIVENRSVEDIWKQLEKLGVMEQVTDADVVEQPQLEGRNA